MTDQQTEIRQLLSRMAVLSDARGVSYIPSGAGAKHDSTGTTGPGNRDGDQALLDRWTQRFADAAEHRLASLILLAQRELAQRTHRAPAPTYVDDDGNVDREDTWARDARIVDWYEDVPAEEAAIIESASGTYCPAASIRYARRRNDRDAELGKARPPRERRILVAHELRAAGLSLREIARELNVHDSTVRRYLGLLEADEKEAA